MDTNGDVHQLPAIVIGWDEDTHKVHVKIAAAFKNPEFVLAILGIACREVESVIRFAKINQLQQMEAEAARTQAIHQAVQGRLKG